MVHGIERVEDRERVLEDGLHFAPERHALLAAQAADIFALVQDLPRRGREKAQQQHGERGFAAATLAGDRQDGWLFLLEPERQVVQRGRRTAGEQAARKHFADMLEFNQRRHASAFSTPSSV